MYTFYQLRSRRDDFSGTVTSSSNCTISTCLSVCCLPIHPSICFSLAFFCVDVPPYGKKDESQQLWTLICLGETISSRDPYHSLGKVSVWPAWVPCHLVEGVAFQALHWLTHQNETACKSGKFQKGGIIGVRQKSKRCLLHRGPYSNVWK